MTPKRKLILVLNNNSFLIEEYLIYLYLLSNFYVSKPPERRVWRGKTRNKNKIQQQQATRRVLPTP